MVLDHYVGGIHNLNAIHFDIISVMWTDSFFWFGIEYFLGHHLNHSKRKTFQYINSHVVRERLQCNLHYRLVPDKHNFMF